jgi:dihydrofolate reductase
MRELIADLFISLDGFASGINQPAFFGYFGQELEKWVRDHLNQPQIMIMGRVTYQALAGVSASASDEISFKMSNHPKLVFSSTLEEPLVWKNSRVLKGDLAERIKALKAEGGDPIRSIGSITLVRYMMHLGLVDRLRLMIFPLVLGEAGREPIYIGYPQTGLELLDTKVLDSRISLLEYRPVRRAVT